LMITERTKKKSKGPTSNYLGSWHSTESNSLADNELRKFEYALMKLVCNQKLPTLVSLRHKVLLLNPPLPA
jgi:hypothetical protein